jgi:hypothetical protein
MATQKDLLGLKGRNIGRPGVNDIARGLLEETGRQDEALDEALTFA